MVVTTAAKIRVPIQYTETVTITAECCRMSRFEIKIHAMAANIESTTSRSPRMLACAVLDVPLLDNAISAAPTVEAASASHPLTCNRSPENNTAAMARSMGSVATMREA